MIDLVGRPVPHVPPRGRFMLGETRAHYRTPNFAAKIDQLGARLRASGVAESTHKYELFVDDRVAHFGIEVPPYDQKMVWAST